MDAQLTLEEVRQLLRRGEIDTVMCATPDPYGRLVGKRLTAKAFENLCVDGEGVNSSTFIFAVDMDMNPIELPVSNIENGYVDFRLVPDVETFRRHPWEPTTVVAMCDAYEAESDELLAVAPRSILRTQIERARQAGLVMKFASELEFYLARTSPNEAWARGYRDLEMLSNYRSDYQMQQAARDEWLIRELRNGMNAFGVPIESSKPEWGLGQQEVTLDYTTALEMADRHVLFKFAVKDLAFRHGMTCTFMAKPLIEEVGSSCHLHMSLWSPQDEPLCWASGGMSPLFGSFVAGLLAHSLEMGYLLAPTINSYKRFLPDQFAGTAITLGFDNRSCAFRLVGHGPSFRVENRIPGADVNPYYAYSATIVAGLAGIAAKSPSPAIHQGNAWADGNLPTMWSAMHQSIAAFERSTLAKEGFGPQVYEHLLLTGQKELQSFDSGCVTDWERLRYYERV
ncbi:MAG: glutamine synthetase family protein [Actinomycetales bacterium]